MDCPRCQNELNALKNHDIELNVCTKGCGGIWFDWMELKKMDESHESDPEFLKQLSHTATKKIDLEKKINCPECKTVVMYRRYWSVKKQLEFDECPQCGGVWLDAGELTHIYAQFSTEEERKKAAEVLFEEAFGKDFEKLKHESQEDLEKARKFSHALRFICPSYYIRKN